MNTESLLRRLHKLADDPMLADWIELNKKTLRAVARTIEEQRERIGVLEIENAHLRRGIDHE